MSNYILDLRKYVGHRPLLQVGAGVIVENEKGKILLQLRSDNRCWGYAGGSVEPDEKIEDAARRELLEETGLIAHDLKLFDIVSGVDTHYIYPNGDEVSNVEIVFRCKRYSGVLRPQAGEVEALNFFSAEELPHNLMPPNRPAIHKWKEEQKAKLQSGKTNFTVLSQQLRALTADVPYLTANLANISALLFETMPDLNWAGFYLHKDGKLVLGPFQGKPACIEIPIGKGVCGTAFLQNETLLVKNVHDFPGHIACDSASNSEIVVPIRYKGKAVAVLDLDSRTVGRFTDADKKGLEAFVRVLEETLGERLGGDF